MFLRSLTACSGIAPGWSGTPGAGTCSCICSPARRVNCTVAWPWTRSAESAMGDRTPSTPRWSRARPRTTAAARRNLTSARCAAKELPEEALESLRLFWPAYFASRERVMPFLVRFSVGAYAGLMDAAQDAIPRLERALTRVDTPFGCIAGARSPLPHDLAAAPTARSIPGAWLDVIEDAGHFPWFEHPGCVRAALKRLVATAQPEHRAGSDAPQHSTSERSAWLPRPRSPSRD